MTTDDNTPPTKGDVRAQIFSQASMDKKSIPLNFYGAGIEIRQPSVGQIENLIDKSTNRMSFIQVLIDHAYVPGTKEKVFSQADYEQLQELPYTGDMAAVADAITKLTDVKVKEAEKN